MCTLHDFSVLKSNLFIRALLLDRILVTEKTTRTPRVHLVLIYFYITLTSHVFSYITEKEAYAKFRCGLAPIIIETCRYGLQRVSVEQLLCETCHVVEDEFHVVMGCTLYDDIRKACLCNISGFIPFLCSL